MILFLFLLFSFFFFFFFFFLLKCNDTISSNSTLNNMKVIILQRGISYFRCFCRQTLETSSLSTRICISYYGTRDFEHADRGSNDVQVFYVFVDLIAINRLFIIRQYRKREMYRLGCKTRKRERVSEANEPE